MPPNSILRISTGRGLVRGGRRAGPPGKIGERHGNGGKAAEAAWRPGRAQRAGKGDRLLRGGRAGARRAVLRSRARRQAQRRAQGRQWAGGARLALCGERTIQASRSHKILKSTPIARVIDWGGSFLARCGSGRAPVTLGLPFRYLHYLHGQLSTFYNGGREGVARAYHTMYGITIVLRVRERSRSRLPHAWGAMHPKRSRPASPR